MSRLLPWYYLGDIATIYYFGLEAFDTDCGESLLAREEVVDALRRASNAPSGTEHPILTGVREFIKSGPPRHPWASWSLPWPESLKIKVRSEVERELKLESGATITRQAHDYILGPSHLVLPWPFETVNAGDEATYNVQPWDPKADYDPTTDTLGSIVLTAADQLVHPRSGTGSKVEPGDRFVRAKLIQQARVVSGNDYFDLPRSFVPTATSEWIGDTHFEVRAEGLTFRLGTDDASFQPAGQGDPDASPKEMPQYPCGAFGP